MSWLNFPSCDIISALNTINAAIIERYSYMYPDNSTAFPSFDFISRPCSYHKIKSKMQYILENLKILYQDHFPVKNFGRWGHWRPYDDSKLPVEDSIAAELSEAGINPGGVLLKAPMRISDGDFIRGCYHLLNNVLLYMVDHLEFRCQAHLQIWQSEENYDKGNTYADEIKDIGEYTGFAMWGYYKSSVQTAFNNHIIQIKPYNQEIGPPKLQGNWKARYAIQIYKNLSYPRFSDVKGYSEIYDIPGVKEVDCHGTESETIPYVDDITRDLDYYKTWGNYKYGFANSGQKMRLTEVFLTPENLPAPNYKYLD